MLDRPTAVVGASAIAAFGVAAAAAVVLARLTAASAGPARYSSDGSVPRDLFGVANLVALVQAGALLLGVLLVGAALVLGVLRHAAVPATPWVLGTAVVALGVGAVLVGSALAGVTLDGTTDVGAATRLALLRTTLGGLAVAALPALVTSVVRTVRTRS